MELYEMKLTEASIAIRKKEIKARELTESYLSRIKDLNKKTNAFISITEELAINEADKIDNKIDKNEDLSDLSGIPLTFSDDFSLQGIKATAGSKMLKKYIAPYSANVVEKTNEKGMPVLGKTNLDEFGMGSTTRTSIFGETLNPHNEIFFAGDGSAAAVASRQTPVAIGSDTGGRLRIAASFCGVTALRPTSGMVSRYGLATFASSLAQAGIVSANPADITPVLQTIAGFDPRDTSTIFYKSATFSKNKGDKIIIGYPESVFEDLENDYAAVIDDAVKTFPEDKYEIKKISLPHFKKGLPVYYVIAYAESFSNLSRYDGIRYGNFLEADNLEELYQRNRKEGFGEEAKRRSFIGAYLTNDDNYKKYYEQALKLRKLVQDDFYKTLQECDTVILPVSSKTAPACNSEKNFIEDYEIDEFCAPVSLSNLPAVSVPVGYINDLPYGIQLIGNYFSDYFLIEVAADLIKYNGFV